jgi:hypothetical protein
MNSVTHVGKAGVLVAGGKAPGAPHALATSIRPPPMPVHHPLSLRVRTSHSPFFQMD